LVTIFTIPKPFIGHNAIIQYNAIKSWAKLEPECEIILFGNDLGVVEIAKELAVKHVTEIDKNEYGTPLLSSAFATAQKSATNNILMYANADVIFFQDLIYGIQKIENSSFLACGRRWDLDMRSKIDFEDDAWSSKLQARITEEGVQHSLSGIDYFIFPRNLVNMPPFIVGRPGWDTWLIFHMRSHKIPVIDASGIITAIHQNHDYSHSKFGEKKRVGGPEFQENINIAGGRANMLTLRDANWKLTRNGLKRPDFPERIFSLLSLMYPWRLFLVAKRTIQDLIGF
jgi:hypothetical protein